MHVETSVSALIKMLDKMSRWLVVHIKRSYNII
jgi:hypothetical protein